MFQNKIFRINLILDVEEDAQRAALNAAVKPESAVSDASTQSDPEVPDEVLLRGLDEVDRMATEAVGGPTDDELAKAAADAERAESSAVTGGVVASTERAPGDAATPDSNGASGSVPAATGIGASASVATGIGASASVATGAKADAPIQEGTRQTTIKLQAFAFNSATETHATGRPTSPTDRAYFSRQQGVNESSPLAQGPDVLASQTIQAGGGVKRVHARLILSNNKPAQLIVEPARASGRRCDGHASDDHPAPAKRPRASKRNAHDKSK